MGMQTSTFPQFCATRFVAAVMLVLLLCSVTIEASACAADFEMQGDIAMSVSNNDSKIQNTHVRDAAPIAMTGISITIITTPIMMMQIMPYVRMAIATMADSS